MSPSPARICRSPTEQWSYDIKQRPSPKRKWTELAEREDARAVLEVEALEALDDDVEGGRNVIHDLKEL